MDIDITISLSKRQYRLLADIGNAKDVPRSKNLMMQALAKKGLVRRLWGKGWALSPLGWQVFWKLNDRNMEGKC
ncbi:hypothetical protein AB9L11_00965 [Desulfovibrio piger]